jgi:hypothetical protein
MHGAGCVIDSEILSTGCLRQGVSFDISAQPAAGLIL